MATRSNARVPTRVGIVTVSYGSEDVLPEMLASIPAAVGGPADTVVVDNRPDDRVRALADAAGARYLARPDNPGYGGAMNAGAATFGPEIAWILIANPDTVLSPGSVATLVARGEAEPDAAAIGPLVRRADGSVYPSARSVPSLRTGVGHALLVNLWSDNPWTRSYRQDLTAEVAPRDAGWLSGSCVLVRRSAFESIGGFDDGYFMYFEDVDLGYRFGKAGLRNIYEPAAEVLHTGAHATQRDSGAMVRAHHTSARRFLARKYAGPVLWPLRVVLSVGLRVRSALLTRRRAAAVEDSGPDNASVG